MLHGLLKRIAKRGECEHSGTLRDFFSNKEAHWERLFDLAKAEGNSARRKFDHTMKTDGYAVSIGLSKPKPKAAVLPDKVAWPDGLLNDALFNNELFDIEFFDRVPEGVSEGVEAFGAAKFSSGFCGQALWAGRGREIGAEGVGRRGAQRPSALHEPAVQLLLQ